MCLYVCVSYVCVGELWCIVYMCGSEVYSMYTCGLWCVYCVVYGTRVYVYVVYAVCMCVCEFAFLKYHYGSCVEISLQWNESANDKASDADTE